MILRFPYLDEPLYANPPPSLPDGAQRRWRPLVPLSVRGLNGRTLNFGRALVDPGADDTVLPLDVAELLAVSFYPVTRHSLQWRGTRHSMRDDTETSAQGGSKASELRAMKFGATRFWRRWGIASCGLGPAAAVNRELGGTGGGRKTDAHGFRHHGLDSRADHSFARSSLAPEM